MKCLRLTDCSATLALALTLALGLGACKGGGAAPGAAALAIGLAPPRTVSPASEGVWAGDGLTVRPLAGAAELEVSLYGARRCRFARVDGAPPPRQRGL